jgi:hypothetical protein
MNTYIVTLYTKNDKYPSDFMTKEQVLKWVNKNKKKVYTISKYVDGVWSRDINANQLDK